MDAKTAERLADTAFPFPAFMGHYGEKAAYASDCYKKLAARLYKRFGLPGDQILADMDKFYDTDPNHVCGWFTGVSQNAFEEVDGLYAAKEAGLDDVLAGFIFSAEGYMGYAKGEMELEDVAHSWVNFVNYRYKLDEGYPYFQYIKEDAVQLIRLFNTMDAYFEDDEVTDTEIFLSDGTDLYDTFYTTVQEAVETLDGLDVNRVPKRMQLLLVDALINWTGEGFGAYYDLNLNVRKYMMMREEKISVDKKLEKRLDKLGEILNEPFGFNQFSEEQYYSYSLELYGEPGWNLYVCLGATPQFIHPLYRPYTEAFDLLFYRWLHQLEKTKKPAKAAA